MERKSKNRFFDFFDFYVFFNLHKNLKNFTVVFYCTKTLSLKSQTDKNKIPKALIGVFF
jgi:hypothetical protein